MSHIKLMQGDCFEQLKKLSENSIDAIVTDPPYGLSSCNVDAINEVIAKWANGDISCSVDKKGFYNLEWDSFVPPPAVWKEVFRVTKCGAHLLIFSGTRTFDLMAISLRLAGFEIRDTLVWVHNDNFPKTKDISKAIDKLKGAEREVIGECKKFSGRRRLFTNLGKRYYITKPATDEADKWEGWNTTLKPAVELIILARKPLSEKTSVENILKWNVGGLNIDACRFGNTLTDSNKNGRYPSNFIIQCTCDTKDDNFDNEDTCNAVHTDKDCPCYLLDLQQNEASKFFYNPRASNKEKFFYCKVCNAVFNFKEFWSHNHNLKDNKHLVFHFTQKPLNLIKYLIKLITPIDGIVLDPFLGSGTTAVASKELGFNCIGVEKEADYIKIAEKRIKAMQNLFTMGENIEMDSKRKKE